MGREKKVKKLDKIDNNKNNNSDSKQNYNNIMIIVKYKNKSEFVSNIVNKKITEIWYKQITKQTDG